MDDILRVTHSTLSWLSPSTCEACGKDLKEHEWADLDTDGIVVRCNFK